jgi:two-component system, OmpR family, sensor histidine kinase ChvG
MIRNRALSRIGARLLAFNLLVLFLPVAAILYLDVYEARLLESQERSMNQQARIVAAALAHSGSIDAASATDLLTRLEQRTESRVRVYDHGGALLADSNRIRYAGEPAGASTYPPASDGTRERALYRLGAWIAGIRKVLGEVSRKMIAPRGESASNTDSDTAPAEVRAALSGRYGAATRPTPGQRSLTLSVAVPIRAGDSVSGAVLISQSTFRVLQALYDVRLRIFAVVIGSLVAAVLLTTLAAATIVRPIRRLRSEATALAERRHRLPGAFPDSARRDELGELARALSELTRRLDGYIRETERFAADVSHEFKNPLASIRVAAETVAQSDDPSERQRFLTMLTRDVDRLERLVSAVREQTRIDARLDQEPVEDVNVGRLIAEVIQGLTLAQGDQPEVRLLADAQCCVTASRDRLAQAFENVLSNARSFAPLGTAVDVQLSRDHTHCRIEVADRGPGIPPEHIDRVFERFFSYRPDADGESERHTGLGLSIARTIVESYGGTIEASNREDGSGSRFEIRLPLTERAG